MKKLLLLILLLPFVQCSKDKDEKACYVCDTYYQNVYESGEPWKDTVTLSPCQTTEFIEAYIKSGTGTGRKYVISDSGDTLYYNFTATTTCTRK
jgi:hypothetical protein